MHSNEDTSVNATVGDSSIDDELSVFNRVASALKPLSPEARSKMFKTLATFFDISIEDSARRNPVASARVAAATDQVNQSSFSEDRALSPKQFVLSKKPHSDIDRVAVLAYYLTHYRDTPHFKTLDISQLNTEAAQTKLSNPAAAVDNASTAGLLVQVGQGKKQISAIGEIYVQALPDRAAARAAAAEARPRRARAKAKSSAASKVVKA